MLVAATVEAAIAIRIEQFRTDREDGDIEGSKQ
jgi:hypothetical protein